jgi:hypothetical protein
MIKPSRYVQVRVAGRDGASSTASIPVYIVTSPGLLSGIHACRVLGSDDFTQGVACADLFAEPDGSGGVEVTAETEGICQIIGSNSFPECANITMLFSVNSAVAHNLGGVFSGECGHQFGPCESPRTFFAGNFWDIPGPCNASPGSRNEVWTVVFGGADIELPSTGDQRFLASNLGSQHAIVCA